jgi:probable addiction module antidote protein
MAKKSRPFREGLIESLRDPIEAAGYINAAIEDSPDMLLVAMRDVAEAYGMAQVAKGANISRESIYRMLSHSGNPTLESFTGILGKMGLCLKVEAQVSVGSPQGPSTQEPAVDVIAQGTHDSVIPTTQSTIIAKQYLDFGSIVNEALHPMRQALAAAFSEANAALSEVGKAVAEAGRITVSIHIQQAASIEQPLRPESLLDIQGEESSERGRLYLVPRPLVFGPARTSFANKKPSAGGQFLKSIYPPPKSLAS